MKRGMRVKLKGFYADLLAGTEGTITKAWTDPHGNGWVRLFICVMQDGRRVTRAIPTNMLER